MKRSEEAAAPAKAPKDERHLAFVAQMASAYLGHNIVPMGEVGNVIDLMDKAVRRISNGHASDTLETKPAVPIKKSVFDGYIVCLEDGKHLTMLKRYLWSQYKMTPDDYRKKWGLPHDYPMVAPAYARLRSAFAKKIGLGKVPAKARK